MINLMLDCNNSNEVNKYDYDSINNSIFFSGLCDTENFDLSQKMWTQMKITNSICSNSTSPIKTIDAIKSKINILEAKVIETPGLRNTFIDNYEGKKVSGRKLSVSGNICLNISYILSEQENSLNSFDATIPFSTYIVVPYTIATKDSLEVSFNTSYCIEEIYVQSIIDNMINLSISFVLSAEPAQGNTPVQMPCSMCENNNAKILGICPIEKIRSILPLNMTSSKYWNEITLSKILTIHDSKPSIDEILSIAFNIDILCTNIISTPSFDDPSFENKKLSGKKLLIEGVLNERITYVTKDNKNSVYSSSFNVPISTYIVIPNTTLPTDKFEIIPCVENIYYCNLNDRQIFEGLNLFIKANPIDSSTVKC